MNNKSWTKGPSFIQQRNDNWFDIYTLEVVIQNNVPETIVKDYQTELEQIPEANIINSKITSLSSSAMFDIMHKNDNSLI